MNEFAPDLEAVLDNFDSGLSGVPEKWIPDIGVLLCTAFSFSNGFMKEKVTGPQNITLSCGVKSLA